MVMGNAIKQCVGCGQWKAIDAFHRFRNGWHPRCRDCRSRERLVANADPDARLVIDEFDGLEALMASLLGRTWHRQIAKARKDVQLA
jgi:hypothetical protein